MKQSLLFEEEREIDEMRESQDELARRQREIEEARRRIAAERAEREVTMPPLEEIQVRQRMREHQEIVGRGEIANIRRDQSRDLLLFFLLLAATAANIWWGLRLMQGG